MQGDRTFSKTEHIPFESASKYIYEPPNQIESYSGEKIPERSCCRIALMRRFIDIILYPLERLESFLKSILSLFEERLETIE